MDYFLEQTLNGLTLGCLYAFLALGYTMVYGIIKLINFAHGEVMMVGGFIGFFSLKYLGVETLPLPEPAPMIMAWLVAGALAAIGAGVLAVVMEILAYRPLRNASRISALLTALGVSLFLQFSGQQILGADIRGYPVSRQYTEFAELDEGEALPKGAYVTGLGKEAGGSGEEGSRAIGYEIHELEKSQQEVVAEVEAAGVRGFYANTPLSLEVKRWVAFISAVVGFLMLFLLVRFSRHGRAMRAVSYDKQAAQLMGINVNITISFTFLVGAGLAGICGVIWGMEYGKVEPQVGFLPGLKAFVAAVVGGIGSIPGAVVGGLLLGQLETHAAAYLPPELGGYRHGIAFLALILILLVKPSGFFGRFEGEKI